jgi:DNA-binding NarL/FixJ family response regulator
VLNQHNVSGFVVKQTSAAALVGAIRDAVAGISAARTYGAVPSAALWRPRLFLSARELEVLRSILAGLTEQGDRRPDRTFGEFGKSCAAAAV